MTCAQIMKRPEFENLGQEMDWEIKNGQVSYELPVAPPEAVWRDLPNALSELVHTVRTVKSAFSHLGEMLAQSHSSDPGIIAVLELAERGLDHVSEHECALMDDVEGVFRNMVRRMLNDKVSQENRSKGK